MSQIPHYWIEPSILELMKALNGTFLALSCVTVALRVWTRTRIVRCWSWDDWFILLTLAVFIGECATWLKLADVEGRPASLANLEIYAALICAEQALYITGTVCLKISLAFFFLRFLMTPWSRYIIWISVTLYTLLATSMLFLVIFECGIPGNYVFKQASHQCVSFRIQSSVGFAHGAVNALTDWLFPILAITYLTRTKLSPMAKVSCAGILGLAVLGSIASIVRTVYIPDLGPGGNIYSKTIKPLVWTLVEGGLGIIAASLATLRPLFQRCSTRTKEVLQSKSTGERPATKNGKSSLSSTLNCFGSTSPVLAVLPQESEKEKCDSSMDLESGKHPNTTTRPLHLGILSSVATETELNTKVMDKTRTTIRGLESAL